MTRRSASNAASTDASRSRLENDRTLNRITFRATDDQLAALESLVEDDVYHSRSEALRAGIQQLLEHHESIERDRDRT
ncbi:ribbon-helix-helix domain-containing protein [Halopiger xanaduensis]|uniref:Putative transcriptional regulator, CopG family n=1 Tax=Halopiger xanaduensis (strain DSM 18323 / JCM 14033 / SH-6) TaxID=797210 RepID=F8DDN5_HALXS|nr:ribbon-helix-helix domain-containing protein [Halopiger xanaduensis]AEH39137.1 putative transcriptional regulator, CopG family [Halopiger xanaduensis SH-6]